MPSRTDFEVPPFSWMVKACNLSESLSFEALSQKLSWFASQPRPMPSTAKKFGCFA